MVFPGHALAGGKALHGALGGRLRGKQ
jgi:hypothetical protein